MRNISEPQFVISGPLQARTWSDADGNTYVNIADESGFYARGNFSLQTTDRAYAEALAAAINAAADQQIAARILEDDIADAVKGEFGSRRAAA